jgi:hypothetical protein
VDSAYHGLCLRGIKNRPFLLQQHTHMVADPLLYLAAASDNTELIGELLYWAEGPQINLELDKNKLGEFRIEAGSKVRSK